MTTRPVPLRIAGYNPVAPLETGRVPTAPLEEPPVEPPAYPPTNPAYFPDDFFGPPPTFIPPPFIPPVEPPCDPEEDPECDDDPEDPPEVPEPGMIILLLTGVLVYWLFQPRRARV